MAGLEGQSFDGFTVRRKLGEGGMGAVYEAHQAILDRAVALKTMAPDLARDADYTARFQREAASAAKLDHPNIVRVYTAGTYQGAHYIAMEYVEGETVQARIDRLGKVPPHEAVAMALYVAQALQYAWNEVRLIHRDIKPQNVFLSTKGDVKLGDLGLAKVVAEGSASMTTSGTAMGTPHYISPEQARGAADIDFRADIYSLGCTLFHLLTGRPPYRGSSAVEVMAMHMNGPPASIFKVWPACPKPLGFLVSHMMARDRVKRFQSYEKLVSALWEMYEQLKPGAPPVATHGTVARAAAAPPATPRRQRRSMLPLAIAVGLGVLALVGLLVGVAVNKRGPARTVAAVRPAVPRPQPSGPPTVVPPGRIQPAGPTAAKEQAPQPGQELSVDLGGGVTLACVWIPPGEFMMGSPDSEAGREKAEGPVHRVRLTKGFWLGKCEVTQEQYERVTGQNPSQFKGARNPVEKVNWHAAVAFCDALAKQVGKAVRLPTEAEWEYACRAGTTTAYHTEPSETDLAKAGWYKSNSGGTTHPVGAKVANAWGLYDMHGNVWEWCADGYDKNYYGASPATDPRGPAAGSLRVVRGGSWNGHAFYCRVAYRNNNHPGDANSDVGFRVVLPPGQP